MKIVIGDEDDAEVMTGKTSVLDGAIVMLAAEVAAGKTQPEEEDETEIGLTGVEDDEVTFQSPQIVLEVVVGITGLTIVLSVEVVQSLQTVLEVVVGITGLTIVLGVEVVQSLQTVLEVVVGMTGLTGELGITGLTGVLEDMVKFQSPQIVLEVVVGITGLTMVLEVVFGLGHGSHAVVETTAVIGLTGVDDEEVRFQSPQMTLLEVETGATGVENEELEVHGSQAVLETT